MKRFFLIVLVLFAAGIAVVAVVVHRSAQTGSSEIEQWIGAQLQEVANSYLNPTLSYSDLDYQYPGTVTLRNLKLEANDADRKITILGAVSAKITLAEIPRVGQPIVIERVVLDSPECRAIAVEPLSGRFVGFSNLLRSSGSPSTVPTTQPASPSPRKLSDYFRMKLIELNDGKLIYDPRLPGTEAMELDKIHTRLDLEPGDGASYRVKCGVERDPVFTLLMQGLVDINTFRATGMQSSLKADLSAEKLSYLPPQLQKLLKQYDARGALVLDLHGDAPLFDPLKGDIVARLVVTQAHAAFSNYRIPVDLLSLEATLKDSKATVKSLQIEALEGNASASGSVMLTGPRDADIQMDVSGMKIQNLASARSDGKATQFAGEVNARLQASASAAVVVAKWVTPVGKAYIDLAAQPLPANWGTASIHVKDGQLMFLPALRAINSSLRKITPFGGSSTPKDKLDADAIFSEDRIEIRDLNFAGDAIAARGRGVIGLDHSLDFTLNGGPLEKVQSKLGEFGKIIGAVTDSIASYRVTGAIGNPVVSVQVGAYRREHR